MAITIDPEPVWDQPIDVPEKWIKSVNWNVRESESAKRLLLAYLIHCIELPEGSQIKGIFPYGASYWTRTAEIQTEQADGTPRSFFLKVWRISSLRSNAY